MIHNQTLENLLLFFVLNETITLMEVVHCHQRPPAFLFYTFTQYAYLCHNALIINRIQKNVRNNLFYIFKFEYTNIITNYLFVQLFFGSSVSII